jgi:hypothetical protein
MKKLLVLLLIATLAAFVFVGCDLIPSEGEGEGEGEGEPEEVTVEIATMVDVNGWTYVKGGNRAITVTFPAPVSGVVTVEISDCSGDYSKEQVIGLFPNADKTVFTGSAYFNCTVVTSSPCAQDTCEPGDCCASLVTVKAGQCEEEGTCLQFPVIVDCKPPYVGIEVEVDDCSCASCEIFFKSVSTTQNCEGADECCGDDCSAIAGWTIRVYDFFDNPFDRCCNLTCTEPIWSDSGMGCPIDTSTDCLEAIEPGAITGVSGRQAFTEKAFYGKVYVLLVELEDNVGNVSKGLFALLIGKSLPKSTIRDISYEEECCAMILDINVLEDCVDPEDENSPWYGMKADICQTDWCEWLIEVGDQCEVCDEVFGNN